MNVSVIGLGKLGLPLAAVLASKGHRVIGVDANPEVVEKVQKQVSPIQETGLSELLTSVGSSLTATMDYQHAVAETDVSMVIVPTPSNRDGTFSNQYVMEAVRAIGRAIQKKETRHLVVICSTVMPGSCGGEIRKALEGTSGRKIRGGLGLCYSPEFIALGSVIHDILNPDMVLIGASDPIAGDRFAELWATVTENDAPMQHLSLINAEVAKIAINLYLTTKISFANVLAEVCERQPGADAAEVAHAVGLDARIGGKYLRPATAYGGPCFPRDTRAFAALGSPTLPNAIQQVNREQIDRLVGKVLDRVPCRVAILGLAYKPDTPVWEESVGVAVARALAQKTRVLAYDPGCTGPIPQVTVVGSAKEAFQDAEVVVITTPWPEFADLPLHDQHVIDCWGLLADRGLPSYEVLGRG